MRDLFTAPDPYAAIAFAHDSSQGEPNQSPRERLVHMCAAYSRAYLLTGPNVPFLRTRLNGANSTRWPATTSLLTSGPLVLLRTWAGTTAPTVTTLSSCALPAVGPGIRAPDTYKPVGQGAGLEAEAPAYIRFSPYDFARVPARSPLRALSG
jgi:hypothetical protein